MSADKLASFRVDNQLWEQFQSYAKENNTNASALLVAYIKSVVNTGNVITYNPVVNTSNDTINPTLSIQDIDKRIDDKIKLSIQNIGDINTLSLQDIDNRIADSLADGGIGEAIASSYAGVMENFNGLLDELQQLKKQLQELQSNPPAPVPCSQLPIPDDELPITDEQIPDPNKNQIENIRTTLKRRGIQSISNDQIRNAFKAAGWDGQNYKELRQAVVDSLSAPK